VQSDYTISTKQNQQRRLQNEGFTIWNKPRGVNLTDISFLPSSRGDFQDYVYVIFKCKDDCETIFTDKHIKEMLRFSAKMTDDPLWSKVCRREGDGNKTVPVDGVGCSSHSYLNFTRFYELAKE
jgi:hypothetical protein